jgi:hypothetical protein
VTARRKEIHVPKFNPKVRHWTAEEDKLLGTMSDEAVSARLQRPLSGVVTRRNALGIAKFQSKNRPWTREEDALLGTMPDKKLARKLKRSYDAVGIRRLQKGIPANNPKRKPWRPEDDKILGTRPDDEIARFPWPDQGRRRRAPRQIQKSRLTASTPKLFLIVGRRRRKSCSAPCPIPKRRVC